ncbi:MAG: ComF family protein [Pseudomonadales bacterium]|nr:ComF family protein [Pseudomonadales bacterium]
MITSRSIFDLTLKPLKYNGVCVLCRDNSGLARDLCHSCEGDLPFLHPLQVVCQRCGVALNPLSLGPSSNQPNLHCGVCLKQPPYFHQTIALMEYTHPVDAMIRALKLGHEFQYLNVLCLLLGKYLTELYQHTPKPSALIAVPLHRSKLVARGFNQSQMIASKLSKHLAIPALNRVCLRHNAAERQSGLDAQQRRRNLLGAFSLTPMGMKTLKQHTHVAIVDDVMTTGSTANELAKILIQGGVDHVDVICFARTGLNQ